MLTKEEVTIIEMLIEEYPCCTYCVGCPFKEKDGCCKLDELRIKLLTEKREVITNDL